MFTQQTRWIAVATGTPIETITLSLLERGKRYFLLIFQINGADVPVYKANQATVSLTVGSLPNDGIFSPVVADASHNGKVMGFCFSGFLGNSNRRASLPQVEVCLSSLPSCRLCVIPASSLRRERSDRVRTATGRLWPQC
jgi:hypothetical protein